MESSDHWETLDAIREHYAAKVREHGDSPAAVQWADRASQERRMGVLAGIAPLTSAKVLDFGCGTGHLLTYLESMGGVGEYVGYDLVPEMVELAAAKFPHARFEVVDVLAASPEPPETFDYVLVNGTFNNEVDDNWTLLTDLLRALAARARRGIAFNLLSTYVDFRGEGLAYFEPERVFAFCKQEIGPYIVLRQDYEVRPRTGPYEMTFYAFTERP